LSHPFIMPAAVLRIAPMALRLTTFSRRSAIAAPRRIGDHYLASSRACLASNWVGYRFLSQVSRTEPETPAASEQPESSDEDGGGLFGDAWWPVVAEHCHKRLAQRPQGLPEDPMAQGVLSWVEYELARRQPPPS